MSKVSILIPFYNAESWIAETLESALSQTWADKEIILINDGSTDNSLELVQKYTSSSVPVNVISQENQGVSYARNRALKEASGDYIQYQDADDILAPDAIERRIEALEKSGADVAYSDWQKLVEDKEGCFQMGEIISRRMEDIHPDPEIAIFTRFWAPPAALLYSRRIVNIIGPWNTVLPLIQDARYFLDAALNSARFVHVPSIGAYYRIRGNAGLARSRPSALIQDIFINARQIEDWWQYHGGLNKERKNALCEVYAYVGGMAYGNNSDIFNSALSTLRKLEARYIPNHPKPLFLLSSFLGYRNALILTHHLRHFKDFFKSTLKTS